MTFDELKKECQRLSDIEQFHRESKSSDELLARLNESLTQLQHLQERVEADRQSPKFRERISLVRDAMDEVADARGYEIAQRQR